MTYRYLYNTEGWELVNRTSGRGKDRSSIVMRKTFAKGKPTERTYLYTFLSYRQPEDVQYEDYFEQNWPDGKHEMIPIICHNQVFVWDQKYWYMNSCIQESGYRR